MTLSIYATQLRDVKTNLQETIFQIMARQTGKVAKVRNLRGSEPVIEGTRVPTAKIAALSAAGWDQPRILSYGGPLSAHKNEVGQIVETFNLPPRLFGAAGRGWHQGGPWAALRCLGSSMGFDPIRLASPKGFGGWDAHGSTGGYPKPLPDATWR